MSEMIRVVEAGCAECNWSDETLITARTFESVEEAKAFYADQSWLRHDAWRPHPQGGEEIVTGQGSVWIMPETLQEAPS